MSRARGPQRPTVQSAEVWSSIRASGPQWSAEPLHVRHPVRPAGDDAEAVVGHLHDRQIRLEAAAGREHRRVDHAAVRDVHLARGDRLHAVERAGADDVEDAERGQVEHRGALAHGEMLGVDDRRPPARVPLVLARPHAVLLDERRVRLVPVRTLPRGRLEEDARPAPAPARRTGETRTPRFDSHCSPGWTIPYVLLKPSAARPLTCCGRALLRIEARDVRRLEVDLRLAEHHPLRHRLADPGPFLDPDRGRRPETLTSGVSPSSGKPSGVSERSPLIAYLIPTDSSPRTSGTSSSACSSWSSKSSCVKGSSVGVSAASSIEGISSGSWRIGRCAYEPTSRPWPSCRSYMFVSMSRTIG